MTPPIHRNLPQSTDAEKGVIGSILLSPEKSLGICKSAGTEPKWFFDPSLQAIYSELLLMESEKRPIDLISLSERLEAKHIIDSVGGFPAITELFTFVPTASNIGYYLQIMKEKHLLRETITLCTEFKARAYDQQDEPEVLITEADARLTQIKSDIARSAPVTRQSLLQEYLDEKEEIAMKRKKKLLLPSPLPTINDKVGGYAEGEITLILGPTNAGKSLLGLEHVVKGCLEIGHPSAIFTGEMPFKQYMDRIVCNHGGVNSRALRQGTLSTGDYKKFESSYNVLKDAPLEIYDQKRNKLSLESIEAEIRQLHKKMGLKIVLIDYLQRLAIGKRKDMRRDEELGYATTLFKGLAIELDLWMFVLSSTNDEGQVRDSRGPEYDADNLISIITNNKKVTEKVFIPKWRDGEKSYFVDVEVIGTHCRFREKIQAVKATAF